MMTMIMMTTMVKKAMLVTLMAIGNYDKNVYFLKVFLQRASAVGVVIGNKNLELSYWK